MIRLVTEEPKTIECNEEENSCSNRFIPEEEEEDPKVLFILEVLFKITANRINC